MFYLDFAFEKIRRQVQRVSCNRCIWAGPYGFQTRSRVESLAEDDSELIARGKLFPDIPAAFLEVSDRQIDQLGCRFLCRGRAERLDRFADDPVQTFNRVRGVDDLTDGQIESKKWDHLLPCPAPGRSKRGVFPRPFFLKGIQFSASLIGIRGTINQA